MKIQRSNLDGSHVVDILAADATNNLRRPWAIALDLSVPEPSSLILMAIAPLPLFLITPSITPTAPAALIWAAHAGNTEYNRLHAKNRHEELR